jgi:hypothetical protein
VIWLLAFFVFSEILEIVYGLNCVALLLCLCPALSLQNNFHKGASYGPQTQTGFTTVVLPTMR